MISAFFIDRPVFASVLSIVITLAGLAAMLSLPIAQFPEISPPTVTVTSFYPGASAETIAQTVAAPIEQQITGVAGMLYQNSVNSANGQSTITVTFEIGTNVDMSQINVRNKVTLAEPQLPQDVRRQGVTVEKKSANIMMVVAVYSKEGRFDDIYTSNYTTLNILDELKRLPGAGDVQIMGARDYAMRIWIKPDRMAELGLTTGDITKAVEEQNSQFAAGRIGQEPMNRKQDLTWPVTAKGRLSEPREFEEIIVRAMQDGSKVRVKDIARVELGSKEYEFLGRLNGGPATLISVYLQPGANALDLAKNVRKTMTALSKNFPSGLDYSIPYDTTIFVDESINKVIHTLLEAMVLVIVVVYLFLQSWRATLIPLLAVPVSIIGTFMGMSMLGFTINTLTLFGLILAIGIVVDDAIIVVENVERIMHEKGVSPVEATKMAMEEVTGPVVAIVLVLCAVFVPVGFMGGMTGQMYKQFAVTIAVSVALSGLVALTLSPALAALLLKPAHGTPAKFFVKFNDFFDRMTSGYTAMNKKVLKRTGVALCVFGALVAGTYGLFKIVPGGFVPDEDQGNLLIAVKLPDGATISRTTEIVERVEAMLREEKAIENTIVFTGFDILSNEMKPGSACIFITFTPWGDRGMKDHAFAIYERLAMKFAGIREAVVMPFNQPSVPGLGDTGGFEFYLQNKGAGGMRELADMTKKFIEKGSSRKELTGLSTTLRADSSELFVDVDRDKAKTLGVPVADVFNTLQAVFGSYYINDFNKYGRVYKVQLQAESQYRSKPEDLDKVYVRSETGKMVPIKSLVRSKFSSGPDSVSRFNGFTAAKIIGNAAPGYSSGQAIAAMEQVAAEVLPKDMSYAWSGQAYQEKKVGGTAALVFMFGLVMVFLILAAQYENWSLPISVIMAVPLGIFGALTAVMIRGLENDVYFQIGLVTLIGLAAKNAIMIVEFAVVIKQKGLSFEEAAIEASRLRFRPILMTSLAFILGVVPLVVGSGAGAASRHSIGTGVLGGMTAATVLAIFFVPLFYVLIGKWSERKKGTGTNKAVIASLLALLMLTGCAVGPDYKRPKIDAPNAYRLDAAEVEKIANVNWWELFRDDELNRMVRVSLQENRDLKKAVAVVEQYTALLGQARADFWPQLNADGSAARARSPETASSRSSINNEIRASLGLSFEIDVWGRIRRLTEAAYAEMLSKEETRRTVVLTLIAQVSNSYFELRELDKRLEIAKNTYASRKESLRISTRRFEAGVISEMDMRMAESEAAVAQALIPELERDIAKKENLLSVLLGNTNTTIGRGADIDRLSAPVIPAGLPSELLERRPDIRAAEQGLVAANARIGAAIAEHFPKFSLTGLLGFSSSELNSLFQGGSAVWRIAPNVTLPIFQGGRINAEVEAAEARMRYMLADYENTVLTAFKEVNDALITYKKSMERKNALTVKVESLKRYYDLAKKRYYNGYTSFIEVLDSERALLNAQLELVGVQREYLSSIVDLYKALGGGWEAATPAAVK